MGFKENFPLGLYFLKIGGIGFLSEEGKQVTNIMFVSVEFHVFGKTSTQNVCLLRKKQARVCLLQCLLRFAFF